MRFALVHSFYSSRQPSGENGVVLAEAAALARAGHEVLTVAAHTDDLDEEWSYPLRSAWRVATGWGRNPLAEIEAFEPEIVRVHNLFPNFGWRWSAPTTAELQVVFHNFRYICANALLLRDGATCTRCPDGSRWAGLKYGCYRNSRLATLPVSLGMKRPADHPLIRRADRLIALSDPQREVFLRAGFPSRLEVWPNFLPREHDPGSSLIPDAARAGWVFVGRLTEEKGALPLVEAWPTDIALKVVGAGPEHSAIAAAAEGKSIDVKGRLERRDVLRLLASADGLVVPSISYEAFPLVYLEALAVGTPVLAIGNNAVARLATSDRTGVAVESFGHLNDALHAWERLRPSGATCREVLDEKYSEARFLRRFASQPCSSSR